MMRKQFQNMNNQFQVMKRRKKYFIYYFGVLKHFIFILLFLIELEYLLKINYTFTNLQNNKMILNLTVQLQIIFNII